ncbi:hypothetical protein [Hydrogenophaga sp. 5NK40-0174]|uniref:hypothetical protein n=1 Tax=Hydrogenophaga sp. 5NK40-0174 TaxID=3127649 RepID=UPI003341D90D
MTASKALFRHSACIASLVAATLTLPVAAQTADTSAAQEAPAASPAEADTGIETKAEYIHHEDEQTSIDEVRIGGETRSIRVQPKSGAPGYEISPAAPGRSGAVSDQNSQGNSGRSRWRILNF